MIELNNERYYTVEEAAEKMGVKVRTIYKYRTEGALNPRGENVRLASSKVDGKTIYITESAMAAFIEAMREE